MKKRIILIMMLLLSLLVVLACMSTQAVVWHDTEDGTFTIGCGIHSDVQDNDTGDPAYKQWIPDDSQTVTLTADNISDANSSSPVDVFASGDDESLDTVFEDGTWKNYWFLPVGSRGGTLNTILPATIYYPTIDIPFWLTIPFDNFSLTRDVGTNSEVNNFTHTVAYNHSENVTLKFPVSSDVQGIINVTNNTCGTFATEVNTSDELVNNTFWYDSAMQWVYIRTINLTSGSSIGWTVNCSYGAIFSLIVPPYLEVGQYFESEGFISDGDGDAISGMNA